MVGVKRLFVVSGRWAGWGIIVCSSNDDNDDDGDDGNNDKKDRQEYESLIYYESFYKVEFPVLRGCRRPRPRPVPTPLAILAPI